MPRKIVWIVALLLPSFVVAQSAQDLLGKVEPEKFVTGFVGQCVQPASNPEKIRKAADYFEYIELDDELTSIFGAEIASQHQKAWMVPFGDGAPYILAINTGMLNGVEHGVCTISNPYISGGEVVTALTELGSLEEIADETTLGQRTRAWTVNGWVEGAFITAVETDASLGGGISLVATVPLTEN